MTSTRRLSANSRYLILLLGLVSAITPLAVDMYLPSLPAIASDLNSDIGLVQQSLAVFMLGFAGSQLVYGPLSDRFGRKPILMFGLLAFFAASLLCALADSAPQLIGYRALQAAGGGATAVVVTAIVRDLYQGEQAARTMSLVILSMTLAPLIAPLVGAQILIWLGWRAIFLTLAVTAVCLLVIIWFWLPETQATTNRRPLTPASIARGYWTVLRHRQAMGNLLTASFAFAGMFAFITGSPFVYIQYFGIAPQHYGLLFGSNILLMILLNWTNSRIVVGEGLARIIRMGTWVQLIAGILLVAGATSGLGGLWGVFVPVVVFVGMLGLIGANTTAGTVSPFDSLAGSASALLGACRFLFGATAGAIVSSFHDGTPVPMAATICTCGILAFVSYRLLADKGQPAGESVASKSAAS